MALHLGKLSFWLTALGVTGAVGFVLWHEKKLSDATKEAGAIATSAAATLDAHAKVVNTPEVQKILNEADTEKARVLQAGKCINKKGGDAFQACMAAAGFKDKNKNNTAKGAVYNARLT